LERREREGQGREGKERGGGKRGNGREESASHIATALGLANL